MGNGKVVNILTQSAMVDWLWKNIASLEDISLQTIDKLNIGQQKAEGVAT
jgi:hypothetical protein